MDSFHLFLTSHWLAAVVLGVALVFLVMGRFRRNTVWLWFAGGLGLVAFGGLTLLPAWSVWLLAGAGSLFVLLFTILLISGAWWPPLAWLGAAAIGLGLGGLSLEPAGRLLAEAARALTTIEV